MFDTENNYPMTKRPGRVPKRIVFKNGYKNVFKTNAKHYHRWKYLQGMFASLLDAQWRWTIQFLVLEFFGSWLFFAFIWWLIALVHGDLQEDHLPPYQSESGWTPCVLEVYGFSSCFLFSMETQHTTGYGLRMITEECPEAIFILCVQCIVGLIIDSFTIGLVFAKMIRSKLATHTIQFSRNAVISRRDGKLCFMFRVGYIRRSRLVEVSVRAILIKNERTREGELLNNYQTELCLKTDETRGNILFLWPLTVYHIIDENSPLSDFSVPEILKTHKIEIIVLLTGTVESTGAFTEASSSYLAHEILWDHKFESIVSFNGSIDCYEIDWSKFDNLIPVNQSEESTDDGISKNKSDYPAHLKQKLIFLPSTRNKSEIFLRNEIRIQENQSIYFNKYKNKYFNTFANRKPLHDRFLLKNKCSESIIKELDEL